MKRPLLPVHSLNLWAVFLASGRQLWRFCFHVSFYFHYFGFSLCSFLIIIASFSRFYLLFSLTNALCETSLRSFFRKFCVILLLKLGQSRATPGWDVGFQLTTRLLSADTNIAPHPAFLRLRPFDANCEATLKTRRLGCLLLDSLWRRRLWMPSFGFIVTSTTGVN